MSLGLMGKKLGMTQVFNDNGDVAPVTVIETGSCVIIQKKSVDTDGYTAVKIAFGDDIKEKNIAKAYKGIFEKCKLQVKRHIKEFRVDNHDDYKVGQEIKVGLFKVGEYVDVTGISKGKGFAGTIKRHGFHGMPHSHGHHEYRRAPGSIGSSSFPSRVFKGMKMSGHMGHVRKTVQKLEVVFVDEEKNILMIKGAVPGPNKSIVSIKQTVKSRKHKKVAESRKPQEQKASKKQGKKGKK